ncbi:hypothetical protein BVRB_1g021960 [Beta vulgaris subsp. vulgaris]|nr:hypothetical protein BVRB_1g021960 [Beta vulgaris subsp. vulgaris]
MKTDLNKGCGDSKPQNRGKDRVPWVPKYTQLEAAPPSFSPPPSHSNSFLSHFCRSAFSLLHPPAFSLLHPLPFILSPLSSPKIHGLYVQYLHRKYTATFVARVDAIDSLRSLYHSTAREIHGLYRSTARKVVAQSEAPTSRRHSVRSLAVNQCEASPSLSAKPCRRSIRNLVVAQSRNLVVTHNSRPRRCFV